MQSYDQFVASIFELYESKDYRQALDTLNKGFHQFPEGIQTLMYAKICLNAVLGELSEAIHIFSEAIEQGLWFSELMLRNDPDLALLQGNSEFERLVDICKQRKLQAQMASLPQRILEIPESNPPHPMLIALHGNNGNAETFRNFWKGAITQGWKLMTPQSSQVSGPDQYVWSDRELAVKEVLTHLQLSFIRELEWKK